jgi:GTP-binding protein
VYLIDLSSVDGATPQEQLGVLRKELRAYRPDLLDRPSVVVGSKADVLTAQDWDFLDEVDFEVSSVARQGLDPLKWRLAELAKGSRDEDIDDDGFVIHRPEPVGFDIVREDDASYRVVGRAAERAVALSDISDIGALTHARKELEKLGVNKALRNRGLRDGDVVVIGTFSFEYESDG